jgi:RNA polymerase sigma factor (sigma-70 family)
MIGAAIPNRVSWPEPGQDRSVRAPLLGSGLALWLRRSGAGAHHALPVSAMSVDMHETDNPEVSDEALLVAFGNGDLTAARLLTQRLAPRLLRYAARLLGGDRTEAEDITQESMLRLWKIAPDWQQGEAKVTSWLYRVASNLCTDQLRRRRRQGPDLDQIAEPEDPAPSAVETMERQARMEALDMALTALPERQRQAVILRHIEGLSNPEIAVIMDIGVEAVESLTARGKRALAAALSGRREELGYET